MNGISDSEGGLSNVVYGSGTDGGGLGDAGEE